MHGDLRALPAAARRAKMRDLIERRGFARVSDLAAMFEISEVTVRTDLDALAESHAVRRVHGGAMSADKSPWLEPTFDTAAERRVEEKARIGRAAAALVESHQVVALDVGTTTTAVARALAAREDLENLTIVTNALNIALELEPAIPRMTVVVTGGTLRPALHSLIDPLADAVLERVRADIAFLGCNGVDVDAGITNTSIGEADVKRRMLATAARTIVVADSSKLGVVRASRICAVDDIELLVTGVEAGTSGAATLRDAGLEVELA
ncbi:DeoR/GlpR family DNA-binding transcription regulator [Demequina aestuarii]|uniref:DeoR/GlpR family DNA-binding transcription regulator n=1 Tax=Demequina aestuarii TaxID=327095 RepID=UPI00078591A7|nr:DeoR/GlpR family DNA-binding transcription regulator [Demequina aestuarii]